MKSLTDIIYQYKDKDYKLGNFDCCIFTALVIEEYTEKILPYWRDWIKEFNINSNESYMLAIEKLGGTDLDYIPELILGKKKLPISEVKLGYPVYYVNEEGIGILGICNGARAYFLQVGGGLTARNIEDCSYCWSID